MDEHAEIAAQVEKYCLVLFERWCEKRCVIPLAYLMHGWPLVFPTPSIVKRLSDSLHDLMASHSDFLDIDDCQLIESTIALADRVI